MTEFDLSKVKISNELLSVDAIVSRACKPDETCPACLKRGFVPIVYAEDCPHCYGSDEYGAPVFCAECEYCCGC